MQINVPFNKAAEVSFNLEVSGTSAKPNSVQLSLEKGSTILAFKATDQGNGIWKTVLSEVGSIFGAGLISFSINVLINNRLLTPFKGSALIENVDSISVATVPVETVALQTFEEVKETSPVEEVKIVEAKIENKLPVPVEQPKPVIKEAIKPKAKEVLIQPVIQPKAAILPLLKTVESTVKKSTNNVITETKKQIPARKPSEPLFKVKKVRISYK